MFSSNRQLPVEVGGGGGRTRGAWHMSWPPATQVFYSGARQLNTPSRPPEVQKSIYLSTYVLIYFVKVNPGKSHDAMQHFLGLSNIADSIFPYQLRNFPYLDLLTLEKSVSL